MFHDKESLQEPLFVTTQVARQFTSPFYDALDKELTKMGFDRKVRELCAPAYSTKKCGRPGVDPAVFMRMYIVGYFENIASQRALASKCEDSLKIRNFLGLTLEMPSPDHSSITRFRNRIGREIFTQLQEFILHCFFDQGILNAQHLGIDSSVMKANASMSKLENRLSRESYNDYRDQLAKENGITPETKQAIKNFDRKRSKKVSNKDWVNPHNPDATIGITKDGGWDMLHKPEHLIDLDNGIIVEAEVRKGNQGDSVNLLDRIEKAWQTLGLICNDDQNSSEVVKSLTADGGYFNAEQVVGLRSAQCEVNMRDPHGEKRSYNQYTPEDAQHLKNELEEIRQTTNSEWGIKYRKKRSELVERSFAHILDNGGMRRSHLKGLDKINNMKKVKKGSRHDICNIFRLPKADGNR